ncbi:XTP/dITP diphosphatase [Vulcanisaeta thermophila]|uniref:XTP/dITP diphosphatase n=1 Tax=Vulcanisaeta thermophila TaxID=867917 RepID=UPI000853D1A2|nr:XTP/dITP diphosphatase [Vulcanisaeta thermophila]
MIIHFITGNEHKYREASSVLSRYGIGVVMERGLRKIEIQSENIEDIVKYSLSLVCNGAGRYLVVEDDGLFIKALGGFPGPYSAYVYKTIGLKGILKLMEGINDREAYFKSIVGLCTPDGEIHLFTGTVDGEISREIRGSEGFGYDPIFIPKGFNKTFAELGLEIKNAISHRARAFMALGEWLLRLKGANSADE